MATKMPVVASTLMQEIVCDADTYHLGTKDFPDRDKLVWQETELRLGRPIENKVQRSLQFLEKHQFFTGYCKQHLSTGKEKNIQYLKISLLYPK
jgi:hypothetical protein